MFLFGGKNSRGVIRNMNSMRNGFYNGEVVTIMEAIYQYIEKGATMKNEIYELLEKKINEVYLHFQEKLNIESGDIRPGQLFEQDELLEKLSSLIEEVLVMEQNQEEE